MKLENDLLMPTQWGSKQAPPPPQEQAEPEEEKQLFKEPAVILELSFESFYKSVNEKKPGADLAVPKQDSKGSGVDDHSGRLTKMLVAARSPEEVQAVLSQAYKNLGDALKAAAGGDEDAMAVVKRLHKLIRRANRKTRDLMKEGATRKKQKNAEREKLEQLSKQLELELKIKIAERKQREKKYLLDAHLPSNKKHNPLNGVSAAALEAKIRMIEMMYAMTHASPGTSDYQFEFSGSSVAVAEGEGAGVSIAGASDGEDVD